MKNKNKIAFLGAGIGLMGLILTCSGEIKTKTDDIFKNNKKVSAGYKNVESLRPPLLTLWQVNAGEIH